MVKSVAVTWFLVSVVLWSGLAAAEPPASKPAPPVAVEAPASEGLERGVPVVGQEELHGVVIEEIPKGSTLEKAGLRVGDVITAWKRLPNPPANPEAAEGAMASYFDWQELEMEQAPRGTVVLRGRRGNEPLELTVTPGIWEVKVRPVLPPALEATYAADKASIAAEDLEAAVRTWQSLTESSGERAGGDFRVWLALRIGDAWNEKGELGKAVGAYTGDQIDVFHYTGGETGHGQRDKTERPSVTVLTKNGEGRDRDGDRQQAAGDSEDRAEPHQGGIRRGVHEEARRGEHLRQPDEVHHEA